MGFAAHAISRNQLEDHLVATQLGLPIQISIEKSALKKGPYTIESKSRRRISIISIQQAPWRQYSRIAIMSINVSFSLGSSSSWCVGSRSICSFRRSIIADHRHNNTCIPSLIDNILKVIGIRRFPATAEFRVFVLWLVENYRAAIGNLSLRDSGSDMCNIASKVSDLAR